MEGVPIKILGRAEKIEIPGIEVAESSLDPFA